MERFSDKRLRIAQWLNPAGKLFVHIFFHRQFAYLFETNKDADWMAKHFFTGDIMPSQDVFSFLMLTSMYVSSGKSMAIIMHKPVKHGLPIRIKTANKY